jgi:glycosyltransferase involved in cell wall biosynthesis
MKTVCIVTQSVYETDPRVRRKAEALVAAGYSVDVLALRGSQTNKNFSLNGVNVFTLGLGKKRGSLVRYLFEYAAFFLWTFVRVPLMMRRRRYAVVDVNTLPDFLVFAPVGARWMGASIILDMHEITPEFYQSKYGIAETSLVIRVLTFLEKISFQFADRVITINEPILELLVRRGLDRSKSIVVMNAVDEARFASTPRASVSQDPHGSPSKPFGIMYHGTLTRIYGLDIAIRAFAIAHSEMPRAELWILGSGSEQKNLADLVSKHGLASKVKLLGHVPPADIPAWLDRCELGVLPIRRDVFLDFAFPNKLPEFIVSGKPVLVSRLKTIRYYFSQEALAFAEPNDAEDLARQMVLLYRDAGLRSSLVARAKEEYRPIRWDLMKQRYVDSVDDLAGCARPAADEARLARVGRVGTE